VSCTPAITAPNPVLRQRLARAFRQARAYLLERQSPGGGFCFYRGYYLEEPSLADTWHGVGAWRLLTRERLPGHARHVAFIRGLPVEPQPFALCYRVRGLQALGAADFHEAEVRAAIAALSLRLPAMDGTDLQSPLRRLAYGLWLRRHAGLPRDEAALAHALREAEDPDGGYGHPPNLHDTAEALAVLAACGERAGPRTAAFVRRLAVRGFGFQLTAHSLSPSLETTCAGVACCARLGIPVDHADDAIDFIAGCQTGSGGFALRPEALPDLAWTYLALRTLRRCLGVPALDEGAAA
jgi:hypothetical protein